MPPKKRRAKKTVLQQKQKQIVAQKVTVNLVQPKAKPRRRAIANSGYKAYQQQPQTIFLNNPPPVFPTQPSGGFTPYQQRTPLGGAEIMQEPSRFTQPVPVPVPVPVPFPFQSDATVASNPLRNSSIFEEESPLITRKPPLVTRPRPVTRDPFGIFSNDESEGVRQESAIDSDRATIGVGDYNVIPPSAPLPARGVSEVGRRIPATTNYNRMMKPQLIELAEKYDLPTHRIGAKGKRVALTNDALKDSIRQYLDNNRTSLF